MGGVGGFQVRFEDWATQCDFALNGEHGILQYLDPSAHNKLKEGLALKKMRVAGAGAGGGAPPPQPPPPPIEAASILKRSFDRLESDFVVGLSSELDLSLLLFEKALGLTRASTLYSTESMTEPDPSMHPAVKRRNELPLKDDWNGAARREKLVVALHRLGSPIRSHLALFNAAVKVHQRQVDGYLGTRADVEAAVGVFRSQVADFTKCFEVLRNLPNKHGEKGFGSCSPLASGGGSGGGGSGGSLYAASSARRACTAKERAFSSSATTAAGAAYARE